tara:strand:+ start:224 stop:1975 length:1752 start_codon:yes stop_codon:yes gene_type:complete
MAKSTSLMGKADASLVAAAYREGMANVPADLKGVYDKREKGFKTFTESMNTLFENLGAEDKKTKEEIDKDTQELSQFGVALGNDRVMEITQDVSDGYRDAIEKAETDLDKAKVKSKFNKFYEKMQQAGSTLEGMIQNSANGQLLTNFNSDEQKLFAAMLKDLKDNTNLTNAQPNKDMTDIVYTLPGTDVEMTMGELQSKMGIKDNSVGVDVNKLILGVAKNKNVASKEDAVNDLYSDITGRMNSPNDIKVAATTKFRGMENTIEEMLQGKTKNGFDNPLVMQFFDILKDLDVNNDGKIGDAKDASFATPENAAKLIKEIQGNDGLYKEVIARTVSEMAGAKSYGIMEKNNKDPMFKQLGFSNIKQYSDYLKGLKTDEKTNINIDKALESDIFVGGSDAYMSDEAVDQFNNYTSLINERQSIPYGDDFIKWDGEVYKFKDKIIPNKQAFFELVYDKDIKQSFKSGNKYQGIKDWVDTSTPKLTDNQTLTIENMFSQKLEEGRAASQINDILKSFGVPQRASVPFAPGSNYKIKLGTETFYTDNASDKKLLLDYVNQLIGNVPKKDTETTDKADELLNKYGKNSN